MLQSYDDVSPLAPGDLTNSMFAVLHTAVTSASKCLASCTAAVPTPPEAPLTSTFSPLLSFALLKKSNAVVPPEDIAAASSKVRLAGFSTTAPSSGMHLYSA